MCKVTLKTRKSEGKKSNAREQFSRAHKKSRILYQLTLSTDFFGLSC